MTEHILDLDAVSGVAEKVTQVLRMRAYLMQQNNEALKLLKGKTMQDRMGGLLLLEENLKKERKIISVLDEGAKRGIAIVDALFADLGKEESIGLTKKTKTVIKSIKDVLEYYQRTSLKRILERIEYEEAFLREESALKKRYYLMKLKHAWKKEIVSDVEIYRIIDQKTVDEAMTFWQSVYAKTQGIHEAMRSENPSEVDRAISETVREHIKNIKDKYRAVPKDILKREFWIAFRDHNILPIIIANPLAATFVALSPADMDTVEKAAWAYGIWAVSGFLTRVTHIVLAFKNIYTLADVLHRSGLIEELQPEDVFELQKLAKS